MVDTTEWQLAARYREKTRQVGGGEREREMITLDQNLSVINQSSENIVMGKALFFVECHSVMIINDVKEGVAGEDMYLSTI